MAAKVGKHVRRREVRLDVAAGGEGAEVSAGWGVISPWASAPLHGRCGDTWQRARGEKGGEDEGEKVIKKTWGGTHRPRTEVCPALRSVDDSVCQRFKINK